MQQIPLSASTSAPPSSTCHCTPLSPLTALLAEAKLAPVKHAAERQLFELHALYCESCSSGSAVCSRDDVMIVFSTETL